MAFAKSGERRLRSIAGLPLPPVPVGVEKSVVDSGMTSYTINGVVTLRLAVAWFLDLLRLLAPCGATEGESDRLTDGGGFAGLDPSRVEAHQSPTTQRSAQRRARIQLFSRFSHSGEDSPQRMTPPTLVS